MLTRKVNGMSEIKWSVKAIAANRNQSIEALAIDAGLNPVHLRNVCSGRATMLAKELVEIATLAQVDPLKIVIEYDG